ncbi:MAG: ribokinase [Cyclobacteriaceae bacterium]
MTQQEKILVIGSSNTDMVVKSEHLPRPGETVLGGVFQMIPGGKGANQAVAAASLEGNVTFIAKVGQDLFGKEAIVGFKARGINVDHIYTDHHTPSGVALIMVDGKGENSISVALGANNELSSDDIVQKSAIIEDSGFLLIQLEIPIESVRKAIQIAKQNNTKVILNPAPAQSLDEDLLSGVDIITPNESEAKLLTNINVTDIDSAGRAASLLRKKGIPIVIITMGAQGAYVRSDELDELIPGYRVKAIDSTAAGDTFNGALTVALAEGLSLRSAIGFANQAAAFSVTKLGAQTSVPSKNDLSTIQ